MTLALNFELYLSKLLFTLKNWMDFGPSIADTQPGKPFLTAYLCLKFELSGCLRMAAAFNLCWVFFLNRSLFFSAGSSDAVSLHAS